MNENFKAVEWMRQVRARIDAEDVGLSWKEKQRKTLEILDKDSLWQKLKGRVSNPRVRGLDSP